MIRWLVNAIPKGKRLNRFNNNTKKNIEKNKNIYLKPIEPSCCFIKLNINLSLYSINIWYIAVGINEKKEINLVINNK